MNQVFGEEGNIESDEEGDEEDDEEGDEKDTKDAITEKDADRDYDSMSQDTIEGDEPDFSDEEIPEGETDFTRCIAIEENGEDCIRIRRNGDYCWIHDPENPKVCHKCGKRLKVKQGVEVNGRMKNPAGPFEDCDCTKTTETVLSTNVSSEIQVPNANKNEFLPLKKSLCLKMTEIDKTFLNILVSPKYDSDGYKEVAIHINKKSYLVKIPYQDIKSCITAQNMIRYRLVEHIHTSPPKKHGRKRIYPGC